MSSSAPKAITPLGLPPGSIRALLAIQVVGIFLLLLLVPDSNKIPAPLNLYFLMPLVLVFFVAHGSSIHKKADKQPSPLYMPSGSIRFLILAGIVGTIGYIGVQHPERFDRLNPFPPTELVLIDAGAQAEMTKLTHVWKFYMASLAGGFILGYFIKVLPFAHGWAFQSFKAWVALIAMFSLFLETILQVFVKTTLVEKLDFVVWQCAVTAICSFYYGVRS